MHKAEETEFAETVPIENSQTIRKTKMNKKFGPNFVDPQTFWFSFFFEVRRTAVLVQGLESRRMKFSALTAANPSTQIQQISFEVRREIFYS